MRLTELFNTVLHPYKSWKRNRNAIKVVAIGSLTLDRKSLIDQIPEDEKKQAEQRKTRLGGGGINFHMALSGIAKLYDVDLKSSIVTRVGKAKRKRGEDVEDQQDAAVDYRNHQLVKDLLGINKINIIDLAKRQFHFIPDNAVLEHLTGRGIITFFEEAATHVNQYIKSRIHKAVDKTDILFVHSRYVEDAQEAIQRAKLAGIPVVIDYSVTKQPKDAHLADMQEQLVKDAEYIVAPAEAVIKANGYERGDAETLLDGFVNYYDAEHVAVSNNSDPVQIYDAGEKLDPIPVKKVKDPKLLGIGDTRNGALVFALSLGADWKQAVRIATKVASIKATTPSLQFLKTMKPQDVPELYDLVQTYKKEHGLEFNPYPAAA